MESYERKPQSKVQQEAEHLMNRAGQELRTSKTLADLSYAQVLLENARGLFLKAGNLRNAKIAFIESSEVALRIGTFMQARRTPTK